MEAVGGYEFWSLESVPHFIQDDPELREYDRRDLFGEYGAFYADLLQHARNVNSGFQFAMFTNTAGKLVCGYSVPPSLRMGELVKGLRFLRLVRERRIEAEYRQWKSVCETQSVFREVVKKPRRVLGGALTELTGLGDQSSVSESTDQSYIRLLSYDEEVRPTVEKGEILWFPTASPFGLQATDTRWLTMLSRLSVQGKSDGWTIQVRPYNASSNAIGYAHRCIHLYHLTYGGVVDAVKLEQDIGVHRALMAQQELYELEIRVTEGIHRAFLQDTDPEVFQGAVKPTDTHFHTGDGALNPSQCSDAKETVEMVGTIPRLFSKLEVVALLLPPYSFRDALPGLRNVVPKPFITPEIPDALEMSTIVYGLSADTSAVTLPVHDLARHLFVCGGSGSGKSYFAQQTLLQLPLEVKFLVIDPVKRFDSYVEFYKRARESRGRGAYVIEFGRRSPPKINPFEIAEGETVFSHSALIARAFALLMPTNAVGYEYWLGMIRESYRRKLADCSGPNTDPKDVEQRFQNVLYGSVDRSSSGWYREYFKAEHRNALPTMADVQKFGQQWLGELLHEKKGRFAIEANEHFERWWLTIPATHPLIWQFLSGGVGGYENVPFWGTSLFSRDCIITLGSVSDPQESNTLAALILFLLNEYRISVGQASRDEKTGHIPLAHITLIEEAHRVMPGKARGYGSEAGSSPEQEVAQFLSQMLAEIREYGEGIIIAEQSPSKLTPDAIINTASKVIKRTNYGPDIEALANSASLSMRERTYLPRLTRDEAIVLLPSTSQPIYLSSTGPVKK